MSKALWVLGANTKHLLILPVLALQSHSPTTPSPRNQEIAGESCQSHIHIQTDWGTSQSDERISKLICRFFLQRIGGGWGGGIQ